MINQPNFTIMRNETSAHFTLNGDWTIDAGRRIEDTADQLVKAAKDAKVAILDLAAIGQIDTTGVWLLGKVRKRLEDFGVDASLSHNPPHYAPLFKEAGWREFSIAKPPGPGTINQVVETIGIGVANFLTETYRALSFLGQVIESIVLSLIRPSQFRFSSFIAAVKNYGVRSIPVIIAINFLAGGLVSQQAIFQLDGYGMQSFTVNLLGVMVFRELGVLITAIMMAGRSGSAITAELGIMKMREEVDAIQVMGLSPVNVLATPRIMALIFFMPLLVFIADISAMVGGILVCWIYGGIQPDVFIARLQSALTLPTYFIGLIKAPFIALEIGVLSAMEGLSVQGSAESLGRHVTASVVKSTFMALILGGTFDIIFSPVGV